MKIWKDSVGTIAVIITCLPAAMAWGQREGSLANNLFSQYYTQPGASTVQAGMYPAPHPVPSWTGQTYYTYQPLMPHEMMYAHSRNYYNYYAGAEELYRDDCAGRFHRGGSALNKTTVVWQSGCNHMGPLPMSLEPLQALHYRLASHRYCINGRGCHGRGCHGGGCHGSGCDCDGCDSGLAGEGYDSYDGGCASGNCAANAAAQGYPR